MEMRTTYSPALLKPPWPLKNKSSSVLHGLEAISGSAAIPSVFVSALYLSSPPQNSITSEQPSKQSAEAQRRNALSALLRSYALSSVHSRSVTESSMLRFSLFAYSLGYSPIIIRSKSSPASFSHLKIPEALLMLPGSSSSVIERSTILLSPEMPYFHRFPMPNSSLRTSPFP